MKSFLSNMGSGLRSLFSSPTNYFPNVHEPFAGAWQRNMELRATSADENFAFFSCITLIANDIGKMNIVVKEKTPQGYYKIAESPQYDYLANLLNYPNRYQTSQDFLMEIANSVNHTGDAYVYKSGSNPLKPDALYILNANSCQAEVLNDGTVTYRAAADKYAGIYEDTIIPSEHIIHILINPLFDPLCGISPLFAAALNVHQAIAMGKTSFEFYQNSARPSGLLIAPTHIDNETAKSIKERFVEATSKKNAGNVVVLGDQMDYKPMTITSAEQQLIEQLKFNTEAICACFHIPVWKILGGNTTFTNIEAQSQTYYNDALFPLVKQIEEKLNRGLGIDPRKAWIELDKSAILQMDSATRFKNHSDAIKGGWMTPNEARLDEDLKPLNGGDTVYMQQQNYSLEALAKRDAGDPLSIKETPPATTQVIENPDENVDEDGEDAILDEELKTILLTFTKGLENEI